MLFKGIARLADAAFELYAAALLNDVRRLVRRGVEIRRGSERDRIFPMSAKTVKYANEF